MGKKTKNNKSQQHKQHNGKAKIGKPQVAPKGKLSASSLPKQPKQNGVNLFKLVNENDAFAALGYEDEDEEVEIHEEDGP